MLHQARKRDALVRHYRRNDIYLLPLKAYRIAVYSVKQQFIFRTLYMTRMKKSIFILKAKIFNVGTC
jgi:hypothetical protein